MEVFLMSKIEKKITKALSYELLTQICQFDLTQNLNECEKKSEYTEKNLNLTTKMAFYIEISSKFKAKKI